MIIIFCISPALAKEALTIEESLSTIAVEKRHFADLGNLSSGQKRQK